MCTALLIFTVKKFGVSGAGQDVLAKAKTGTGKTVAFLVILSKTHQYFGRL
jgi:hypothetical protein